MRSISEKVRVGLIAATASVVLVAFAAPSASAATEFGSECVSDTSASGLTAISLAHGSGSPLPVAAPVSGVITSWRTTTEIEIPPSVEVLVSPELVVFRPAGTPNRFTLVGRSQATGLKKGLNVYASRLPVKQGDQLGISGALATLLCQTGDTVDAVGVQPSTSVGSNPLEFKPTPEFQVPIAARIEPDVDGDGYGDETQDGCPQSAAYHSACPVVTIGSAAYAGKKKVTVYVATSLGAPVSVSGSVATGKGKSVGLAAAAAPVVPGQLAAFTLALPPSLLRQLKATPKKKKLTATVTATATNVNGSISSTAATVKLPGQAKPAKRK